MEFWGAEVKSGEPLVVNPGEGKLLHLSQASLGELKKDKGNESVCLFVNVGGKKLVLGTLSSEKLPQQLFDLVFNSNFELSHNWKNGSVYFYGYKADNHSEESGDEDEFDSDEEEDIPLPAANNGLAKQEKPSATEKASASKEQAAGKQKVKIVAPSKEETSDEDDIMSEDESDSEEDGEGSSDDEDDDSDEDDEETPKKLESSKKRPAESTSKTPRPEKKAKAVTPEKTDGKKGGVHIATPHPSKQTVKTPANKSNQQTPKSEGGVSCKSCNKSFKSENALDSHNKAKHSAGK